MKFNLVRIVPDNMYGKHAEVFHEIEAAVYYSLNALGHEVTNSVNEFEQDSKNIVFGMHQCPVDVVRHDVPKNTIVYSLEQLTKNSAEALRWAKKYRGLEVWDYSERNLTALKEVGIDKIKYCKIGYVPELSYFERNKPEDREIDLLFYGSPSPRRIKILEEIKERNKKLNIVAFQGVYGEERDEVIKKSKLVLNIHNRENEIFEMVRVSHLIQNKVPVISERNSTTDFPDYMEGTVFTAKYDDLVNTTLKLLKNPSKLDQKAEEALEIFKKFPMTEFLEKVIY